MAELPSKEDIRGFECKHAVYAKSTDGSKDDLVAIKEVIHTNDGRRIPNFRMVKNYPKNFWITKEGHQNHKDKKEWEEMRRLQKYTTTQGRQVDDIARALGRPGAKTSLKMLARSPYLYGADITTPTLIKRKYQETYPDCISTNSLAVIDIETDVIQGHGRPIYVGITFKDKAFLAVTQEFIGTLPNPEKKLQKKFKELLGEYVESRGIQLEVQVCQNAGEACAKAIEKAHEWQPDFVSAWNIDFDIPEIVQTLKDHNYNLADVFSDKRVPPKYRFFNYRQGQSQKITSSGKVIPVHPADRWHTVECPASFYFIDSMCLYKHIRSAAQNEPSYSLDFQLNQHLGVRKLRFEGAEGYTGLAWHEKMQEDYKIEYGIYNLFDCIGVELFDEKVKDAAQTITILAGASEFKIFNQQPKLLVDQLYFRALEKGLVVACHSDEMKTELDEYTVPVTDWIITLPSHLTVENGLQVMEELPEAHSLARGHVADLDVKSAYPYIQIILNISKETTYRELCRMKEVDIWTQRMGGINLTAGAVNASEIAWSIFQAPKYEELLEEFQKT